MKTPRMATAAMKVYFKKARAGLLAFSIGKEFPSIIVVPRSAGLERLIIAGGPFFQQPVPPLFVIMCGYEDNLSQKSGTTARGTPPGNRRGYFQGLSLGKASG